MNLERSSKIQRKELKVEGDDIGASAGGVLSYLLENVANDDILFEIFVRVSDCRLAILCSSVSRRWHSLISHPRFVPRFISHHQQHLDRYPPPPCTLIFRKSDSPAPKDSRRTLDFQPISLLFPEESTFLHGPPKCFLDFLPSPMMVRALCDDLLLLTRRPYYSTCFYVCNPVTKQFFRLPHRRQLETPVHLYDICGYALLRMPESECHFKVVLFHKPRHPFPPNGGLDTSQSLTIYCSKLGKWKKIRFFYPRPVGLIWYPSVDVVICNGILHWLEFKASTGRVLSLDLLGTRPVCSVIDFPDDFWWFRSPAFRGSVREQIGTVGGELRLIQAVRTKKKFVDLKVWRLLDGSSSSWVLVHDKKNLKMRPNEERFVTAFVHPTDGDVVFMVWGKSMFQCNLMMEEDTYERINLAQEPLKLNSAGDWLLFFLMVHPPWPTPLPST